MATLNTDLRTALVAALRADTTFASIMGNSGGTVHVEGKDQPDTFLEGASGYALCRVAEEQELDAFEESSVTRFRFELRIIPVDVRGVAEALSLAKQGLKNVTAAWGAGIFATYFTDTNSNRLGGSGAWGIERVELAPLETLTDPDRPEVAAIVFCDIGHKSPLV